jgi:hypothetical protein
MLVEAIVTPDGTSRSRESHRRINCLSSCSVRENDRRVVQLASRFQA